LNLRDKSNTKLLASNGINILTIFLTIPIKVNNNVLIEISYIVLYQICCIGQKW